MAATITEHVARSGGHCTFYLAAGPEDGPRIVFLHGWPELALSWRHQLPCFGALGFLAVAPDLRGYGRSSVYPRHEDYAQELIVGDMLRLLDALGGERAVWVGHDLGAPVAWNMASHHPERCFAVAGLCMPYLTLTDGLDGLLALVDRRIYPESEYRYGQWDYMRFYEENFAKATATFDANPDNAVKVMFRKGNPARMGKPAVTATIRRAGGWFGGAPAAPDWPRDPDILSEEDFRGYAAALRRNGFFGPNSWYMNHAANAAYAARAWNGGVLAMPALFLGAAYDDVCEVATSSLAEPMRRHCRDLTEHLIPAGHWLAQEKPAAVNGAIAAWLARKVPEAWPR
jgi:soluble epoxide hydrolase / lipid-phosphate phosphatase